MPTFKTSILLNVIQSNYALSGKGHRSEPSGNDRCEVMKNRATSVTNDWVVSEGNAHPQKLPGGEGHAHIATIIV